VTAELRRVPDFPGLLASDDGHVFRLYPDGSLRRLKETVRKDNYHLVSAKQNGKWAPRYVHRLVASAWYGAPADSQTVTRHLDNDRGNNTPGNLRLGSAAENVADTARAGRLRKGDRHPNARLTAADVFAIKQALAMKVPYSTIAAHWGIHKSTVADIARGRTWRHVPGGHTQTMPGTMTPEQPNEPPSLVA
jgi:hypothetical protein